MAKEKNLKLEIIKELPRLRESEALALCVFEDEPQLSGASGDVLKAIERILRDGEFKGEAETSFALHDAELREAQTLILLGCGKNDGAADSHLFSKAAATAVRMARSSHVRHLYFVLPGVHDGERTARAAAEGATLGLYDNGFYQHRDEPEPQLEKLTLIAAGLNGALRAEVERGRIIAEAVNWTRALADEPGGSLPPREFARRAAAMAEEFGLKVETLSADEIRERRMGGLWGVGKGSEEPPALIVIRYEPEDAKPDDELWAFVGKGITFDTGGISIKHGLDMYEMKTDMAGGAAALGALRAIAQLKLQRRIVGIVPAAENMPSGKAIKPGDVIKTLAGYTIEVVDTDAEGRLVLSDGIAYAKQLGAARIVDLATLTGSIIVALGDHRAGLFSNNDEWAKRVEEAATRAGEPAWRMPVSDDYRKPIESAIADFKNYGGRPDATAAALLLSKFAGDTPWVHLDIAGTSWLDEAQPYAPKGATGAGVRTLVELVSAS
jgi:leucyl aminopeptidase